ncbi:MAG: lipoprotein-releasing ABC transporter permease subunit [Candidatus Omnitrophica bacterium]|nr:lipoprotein-releasing ABC transporter permease subunit [Candidatus Omnitrophota bacterium]
MAWQLFVSSRYLTAKPKERFISLISAISILGVAVGVAALIVVIAVMSGFDNDLKDKIIGTNSHIVVEADYGMPPAEDMIADIIATPHVKDASFFLTGQALIRKEGNITGIIVKGIVPEREARVTGIAGYVKEGSLEFGKDGIVVGSELARKLDIGVGDSISVVSPALPKGMDFTVRGIFNSGMYDYDMNLAYIGLAKAQELFGVKGLASGVSVRADDAFNVASVRRSLQMKLGAPFAVRTWMDLNKNLLAALKLEKTVMFLILTLIVLVACFNIASTLIMIVLEKTRDIGILKAIGASNGHIMGIFALQGAMIGFLGTAAGTGIGLFLCWLLKTYRFISLPKDIYYIDKLPVNLQLHEVMTIIIASLAISLIATLYPSHRASRLDPVEALRYE